MSIIDSPGPIQGSQQQGDVQGGGPVDSPFGRDGWYPIFGIATDGERRVFEVTDWIGGSGEKPDLGYLGEEGIVETAAEAVNIRGPGGATAIWGQILGDLVDQPDLVAALAAKADAASVTASLNSLSDALTTLGDELDTAESAISTLQTDVSNLTTALSGKEPSFTKNTAFNKNFGTGSGEVAEGNHGHSNATTEASGMVELATEEEISTGSDAGKAVTPDGLAGSEFGKRNVQLTLLAKDTDAVVGEEVGGYTYTVPSSLDGWKLVEAQASVRVAGTTGTLDLQVHNITQAVDMLSTVITVDSGAVSSYTAAASSVVNPANNSLTSGDQIRVDVEAIHTTPSKGLAVILTFQKP